MRTRSTAVAFLNKKKIGSVKDAMREVLPAVWLAVGGLTATLVSTSLVVAADAQAMYEFNLPAQTVAESLRAIGQLTSTNILFDPKIVRERIAPAVKGSLTTSGAINLVLAGLGLDVKESPDVILIRRAGERTTLSERDDGTIRLARAERIADEASEIAARSLTLEEIVVTAQKRNESLQQVPISISVLSGANLEKSTNQGVTEALNRIPGVAVNVAGQGGGSLVGVRGVTAAQSLFGGSSPVGYYLDSAPFGLVRSALSPDSSVYDLERIEVLRGPQGTLYGASAQNGVVRVLTKEPNLNELEAKARVSGSGTADGGTSYRGDAALNVPVLEGKLALRAVAGYQDLGGWIDTPNREDYNSGILRNLRLKLAANPVDELTVGLSMWSSGVDYRGIPASNQFQARNVLIDEPLSIDYDLYNLKVSYEFARFSLTSSTSYLDYNNVGLKRSVFSANMLATLLDSEVYSEEINLASRTDGPFSWIAGLIYRNGEDRLRQAFGSAASLPFTAYPTANTDRSESTAAFGEASYRFTNDLQLTLGLRYFRDEVETDDDNPASAPYHPRNSFNATTPRVVLAWKPSSTLNTYVSYSEGFRSGTPQVSIAPRGFAPVEPDRLHNYEIGAKTALLDGRLTIDAATYYIKWNDIQQALLVPFGVSFANVLVNSGSASGAGAELAAAWRPVQGLELGLNAGWNDLTFDGPVFSGGVPLFNKGDRLNASVEHTYGASVDYFFPLAASGLRGIFSASANYQSAIINRTLIGDIVEPTRGNALLISRASIGVSSGGDRWSLIFFGDNLNNEEGPLMGVTSGQQPDEPIRLRPRSFGVQLESRF